MENASKALIMAGAIIIAIVVVSLSVWLFQRSSNLVKSNDFSELEIDEFNSKIEPYCGDSINGSQVNALIQLVYSLDTAAVSSNGESLYTDITYTNGGNEIKVIKNASNELAFEAGKDKSFKVVTGGKYYKVQKSYDSSMRIKSITIENK